MNYVSGFNLFLFSSKQFILMAGEMAQLSWALKALSEDCVWFNFQDVYGSSQPSVTAVLGVTLFWPPLSQSCVWYKHPYHEFFLIIEENLFNYNFFNSSNHTYNLFWTCSSPPTFSYPPPSLPETLCSNKSCSNYWVFVLFDPRSPLWAGWNSNGCTPGDNDSPSLNKGQLPIAPHLGRSGAS